MRPAQLSAHCIIAQAIRYAAHPHTPEHEVSVATRVHSARLYFFCSPSRVLCWYRVYRTAVVWPLDPLWQSRGHSPTHTHMMHLVYFIILFLCRSCLNYCYYYFDYDLTKYEVLFCMVLIFFMYFVLFYHY